MQPFKMAISFGICLLISVPVFAANVYNFDLANQYASGALSSSATFSISPSNQNISVTAAGYAQQGGAGAYHGASLYETTSATPGAAAGLGLSDAANSNKISQNGHDFLQLDISHVLSAAKSAGFNTVGISISGVDAAAKDSFFLFGGSTQGSFVGSTLLAYGSNDTTVNLNLSSLIAKNFDFISILAPNGGVLVNGVSASFNNAAFNANATQFIGAPAIGADSPEPSTTMLFVFSALLLSAFLARRKLATIRTRS
jgi:hypothetical protein